jgi:hypothetical protein
LAVADCSFPILFGKIGPEMLPGHHAKHLFVNVVAILHGQFINPGHKMCIFCIDRKERKELVGKLVC